MKINIKQKLWVKQDFIIEEDTEELAVPYEHKMGDVCIITHTDNSNRKYPISVEFDGNEENYSYAEIEMYFYDKAEWRDNQINSILND